MTGPRALVALAIAAGALSALPVEASVGTGSGDDGVAVIAFVGESALDVLHVDLRARPGASSPSPAAAPVVGVGLPHRGSYADRQRRVAAGPLGHLQPGVVYAIAGTRLMVVAAPSPRPARSVLGDGDPAALQHGTGVVDAAIGLRYGTAPAAVGVLVLGPAEDAWDWVADQDWIDIATTSAYAPSAACTGVDAVRSFVAAGHVVFSSSGNTTDELEPTTAPNGLPEVYQVGGVDRQGRPWLPPHRDRNPWFAIGTVTRPYETGERYRFRTASPSLRGTMQFGGTSGAAPRTAGWAARLLDAADRIGRSPGTGPLRDGSLSGAELTGLMRHVAAPYFPAVPGRFLLEGYGALNRSRIRVAMEVLRGRVPEPRRTDDDAAEDQARAVRAAAFERCD